MSKVLLATNFVNDSITDALVYANSSENSNFPAINVRIPEKQFRPWKTTSAGAEYVRIDLGAATLLTGCFVINTNAGDFKVRGATDSGFTAIQKDTGDITTIKKDPSRKRYYQYIDLTLSTAFNARYFEFAINAGSPLDGQAVWSVGGLVLVTGTLEASFNPDLGLALTTFRSAESIPLKSGVPEVRNIGNLLTQLRFTTRRDLRVEAQYDEMAQNLIAIGEGDSVVFYDNGNFLSKSTPSPFIYVLKRLGAPSLVLDEYPIGSLRDINFIEQA